MFDFLSSTCGRRRRRFLFYNEKGSRISLVQSKLKSYKQKRKKCKPSKCIKSGMLDSSGEKGVGGKFHSRHWYFLFFFTVWTCHRLRRYFHLRLTFCSDKIFFHTAFLISNRYHTKELSTPWLWWPQELHGLMFSILALFCAKSNWKCGSVWQFGSTPLLPLNMRRRLTAFLPLVSN